MFSTLHLPDLPLEAILRRQPELRLVPCAVIDHHARDSRQPSPLLALNQLAARHLLRPGLSSTQALARCPNLTLLARQPDAEHQARLNARRAALAITPTLEEPAPDSFTLSVATIPDARHHPETWLTSTLASLTHLGLPCHLSLAPHPDLAHLAALHASTSARLSFHGPEPELHPPTTPLPSHPHHLHHLPLETLSRLSPHLPDDTLATLHHWGITSLGDLAKLPHTPLVDRLGPAIQPLLHLLQTPSPRPIQILKIPEKFSQSVVFEFSIRNCETLVFLINRSLQSIVSNLLAKNRVASEVHWELRLEDGGMMRRSFRLPEPSRVLAHLLRPIQTHMERLELSSPVIGLGLDVTPVLPRASDCGLFDRALRDPHRLANTLARLESLLGPDSVGIPLPANSHRPDDFQLLPYPAHDLETTGEGAAPMDLRGSSWPLRRFRPPVVIAVAADSGTLPRPLALLTGPRRGTVVHHRGPFLSSGNWWDNTTAWQQAEWDLELTSGHLVRIAFHPPDHWQLEGGYE